MPVIDPWPGRGDVLRVGTWWHRLGPADGLFQWEKGRKSGRPHGRSPTGNATVNDANIPGTRVGLRLGILALIAVLCGILTGAFAVLPSLLASVAGIAWLIADESTRRRRSRGLTDAATALPNVRAMMRAAALEPPAMVVAARIDRFGPLAEQLGPEATARLVTGVADRLRLANREHRIFRIAEDCLAWLETAGDQIAMQDRLEAVVAVMRSPVNCGYPIDVTLTLGIADDAGASPEQLVGNATQAAGDAARKGLRWERFSSDAGEEADWHLSLLGELDSAMASGQVWNAYQPKLDIATGRITGAEALVRWLHPRRGPIAPDDFIPLVEEHGRARDLTFHVLVKALEDAGLWERSGRPVGVAVNVPLALVAEEGFVDQVRQTLHHGPVPPERLTIEVTGSTARHDVRRIGQALAGWRALGVAISIDDRGAGGPAPELLRKLPADEIKIDRSLVQTIAADPRGAASMRSMIELAHKLGMKVVAEGVEDEACLLLLKELGCDAGQGFYIGRPMSAGNLSVFLGGNTREAA